VPVTLELAKVQYDCVKEVKNIAALCGYVEAKEVKYFFLVSPSWFSTEDL
jgi:hypothetical protein